MRKVETALCSECFVNHVMSVRRVVKENHMFRALGRFVLVLGIQFILCEEIYVKNAKH